MSTNFKFIVFVALVSFAIIRDLIHRHLQSRIKTNDTNATDEKSKKNPCSFAVFVTFVMLFCVRDTFLHFDLM